MQRLDKVKNHQKKQKCASGIINPKTDQCWVCSKESRDPIRLRVEKAKKETSKLKSCDKKMTLVQLQERQKWWTELHIARNAENRCWTPDHSSHITEAKKALAVANNCNTFIKELGNTK